jgi:hypothetical protein
MQVLFRFATTMMLLLGLAGCAGTEYQAGNLGQCWRDPGIEFCRVATPAGTTVVSGTAPMTVVQCAVSNAIAAVPLVAAVRAAH